MNYKNLAKISCKVIAITTFIKAFIFLPSIIYTFSIDNNNYKISINDMLPSITTVAVLILFSIILWIFADKISDRMVNVKEEENEKLNINYKKLQYIAFSVIGLFLIATSIPTISKNIFEIYRVNSIGMKDTYYKARLYSSIVGEIIKLLIGLLLLFKSKGLVNILIRLRTIGVNEEE